MILTRFLLKIPTARGKTVLINTLTGGQYVISSDEVEILEKWQSNGNITSHSELEKSFAQQLSDHSFIFDSTDDEKEMESRILSSCRAEHQSQQNNLRSASFVLTYRCNFRCPYCYEKGITESQNGVLSKKMVDAVFEIHNNRIEHIMLYGGEPLLPENIRIIDYIFNKAPNANYGITTNGYYLEEYWPLLQKIKVDHIMVTLDGEEEIHNKSRLMPGVHGTYKKIMAGIKLCLQNHIKIKIRMNISNENITSCVAQREKMISEFKAAYDHSLLIFEMQPQFQVALQEQAQLNDRLLFSHVDSAHKPLTDSENVMSRKVTPLMSSLIRPQKFKPLYSGCSAEKNIRFYDPDGFIYSCALALGNTHAAIGKYYPKAVMFDHGYMFRNIESVPECSRCNLKFLCGGGCANGIMDRGGNIMRPNCSQMKYEVETLLPSLYSKYIF